MITGDIKNKTVIEQLTYLMFIQSLDEKELEREQFEAISGEKMPKIFPDTEEGQEMRWSKFKNKDPRDIYEIIGTKVFHFIKNMGNEGKASRRRFQDT